MTGVSGGGGGVTPHASTHIDGGSDEITSDLNLDAIPIQQKEAQKIVDAINALGSMTETEAQDLVHSMGIIWGDISGLQNGYTISDNVLHSHDDVVSNNTASWVKAKTITINTLYFTPETLRISFDLRASSSNQPVYAQIYKNGSGFGPTHSRQSTVWQTFTDDLEFAQGDTIELWFRGNNLGGTYVAYVRNLRVLGDDGQISLAKAISKNNIGTTGTAWDATNS